MLDATMRQQEQHHVERTNLLLQQQLEAGRTRTEEILKVRVIATKVASKLLLIALLSSIGCLQKYTCAHMTRLVELVNTSHHFPIYSMPSATSLFSFSLIHTIAVKLTLTPPPSPPTHILH